MATRIKDLTTASAIEADDYVVIDGATSGTRKALVSDVGGANMVDFESSLTPSIDSRGVSANYYILTPSDSANITSENATKITAYLFNSTTSTVYPLIITSVGVLSSYFTFYVKSISSSVQSTTSSTVSGKLHVVAPFEITSVTASM